MQARLMLQQSVKHAWRVAQCARNDDAMKSSELIASGPALSVRTGTTNRRPSAEATRQRRIEELLEVLKDGDRLVVSELSRLGRSLGQVIRIVEELVRRKIHFRRDQGSNPLRRKAGYADQGS